MKDRRRRALHFGPDDRVKLLAVYDLTEGNTRVVGIMDPLIWARFSHLKRRSMDGEFGTIDEFEKMVFDTWSPRPRPDDPSAAAIDQLLQAADALAAKMPTEPLRKIDSRT